MKRPPEQTGLRDGPNEYSSVSFLTEYGDVTAIVDHDGDVLLSTSVDPRPVLTIEQFTQFHGAVKALHVEQTKEKA